MKTITLPYAVVKAGFKEREEAEGNYTSKYIEYKAQKLEDAIREALTK
jgi:hypothetical protein